MEQSANNLTYEFHKELNPLVWENKKLKPLIKEKLLEIAEAFLETLDIDVDVEDITLTGSLANYNYTKYSDFDLHILTDYNEYDVEEELLKDYFNAKKTIWNTTRDITIKGYDVEVYIQDMSEPHHSTGVYSIKNDEWITEPRPTKDKQDIDKDLVNKKIKAMKDLIDYAISSDCDVECAEKAKEKFMELRKAGLEKAGELSPENLAFKELRRTGDVERMVQGILDKKSKKLSLDSAMQKENFKEFMGLGGKGSRGPRHLSPTAGMNKLGQAEKGIGMVAAVHKRKDSIPVHNLKKKQTGQSPISNDQAMQLIAQYNLDINKIKSGHPRGLSNGGMYLGFNPHTNTFYLSKY